LSLALEGHGAIQVEKAGTAKIIVTIVGPISFWWQEGNWDSPLHKQYVEWREAMRVALVRTQEAPQAHHQVPAGDRRGSRSGGPRLPHGSLAPSFGLAG